MISTLSVRRFCTPPTHRRGVGQLEALRTFDGDYRSRDLVGCDARIMEPSVERLHDARRRPAFHADDRGQGAGADASDVVPVDVDVLVVAEESLQRRDGIVHRRGGILSRDGQEVHVHAVRGVRSGCRHADGQFPFAVVFVP